MIVALNDDNDNDLRTVLTSMLEDTWYMKLYDQQTSFLWQDKAKLFESIEVLMNKDLY